MRAKEIRKGVPTMPICFSLITAALSAAVVSTLLYHQAKQNQIDHDCLNAADTDNKAE